jgi:hypothetical protein
MEMKMLIWKTALINIRPPAWRKISLSCLEPFHLIIRELTENRENINGSRRIDFKFFDICKLGYTEKT